MPPRLVALGFVLFPGVAPAQPKEAISITLDGTVACTSEADFFARVQRRTPALTNGLPGQPTRDFRIKVEGDAPAMHGRLTVVHLDGRSSARDVTGESCTDVVDALALITAVDIDPGAAFRPETHPAPLELPATVPATVAPPPATVVNTRQPWHFSLGVEPTVLVRVVPQPFYGVSAYVEAESPVSSWLSLQLGFERTFDSTTSAIQGDATFHLTQGFLRACPGVRASDRIRIDACGRVEVGALRGTGLKTKTVTDPLAETRAWRALGFEGRATLQISGPFFLTAQLGLGFPLVRYKFELAKSSLGEIPTWNCRAGLGLLVHFL